MPEKGRDLWMEKYALSVRGVTEFNQHRCSDIVAKDNMNHILKGVAQRKTAMNTYRRPFQLYLVLLHYDDHNNNSYGH